MDRIYTPAIASATGATADVAGDALFGVGAIVNRACTFGSVARLGSGDLAYFATPVGFLAGISRLHHWYAPVATSAAAPLLELPVWMVAMITLLPLFTVGFRVRLPESKATKHEHGGMVSIRRNRRHWAEGSGLSALDRRSLKRRRNTGLLALIRRRDLLPLTLWPAVSAGAPSYHSRHTARVTT